jgi:50S ribosomal subunit-associated GTPase HflX
LDRLAVAIETVVSEGTATYTLSIPAGRGDLIAQLHAKGRVLRCTQRGTMMTMEVELAVEAIRQWGDQWAPFFTMAKGATRRRPAAVASS